MEDAMMVCEGGEVLLHTVFGFAFSLWLAVPIG
jgi:hypothetical protein